MRWFYFTTNFSTFTKFVFNEKDWIYVLDLIGMEKNIALNESIFQYDPISVSKYNGWKEIVDK